MHSFYRYISIHKWDLYQKWHFCIKSFSYCHMLPMNWYTTNLQMLFLFFLFKYETNKQTRQQFIYSGKWSYLCKTACKPQSCSSQLEVKWSQWNDNLEGPFPSTCFLWFYLEDYMYLTGINLPSAFSVLKCLSTSWRTHSHDINWRSFSVQIMSSLGVLEGKVNQDCSSDSISNQVT